MPCATPSPGADELLHRLAGGPIPVDEIADHEAMEELKRWGWAFERGGVELSGAGLLHVGTKGGGILEGDQQR